MWTVVVLSVFERSSFHIFQRSHTLSEKNQGCIETANNNCKWNSHWMKHVEIKLHFIWELIKNSKIDYYMFLLGIFLLNSWPSLYPNLLWPGHFSMWFSSAWRSRGVLESLDWGLSEFSSHTRWLSFPFCIIFLSWFHLLLSNFFCHSFITLWSDFHFKSSKTSLISSFSNKNNKLWLKCFPLRLELSPYHSAQSQLSSKLFINSKFFLFLQGHIHWSYPCFSPFRYIFWIFRLVSAILNFYITLP